MTQLISALISGNAFVVTLRDMLRNLAVRLSGAVTILLVLAFCVALATWTVSDPSLNNATGKPAHNLLGLPGSIVADMLIQLFGLAVILLPLPLFAWGVALLRRQGVSQPLRRVGWLVSGLLTGSLVFACIPAVGAWPLPTGLGGIVGDGLAAIPFLLAGRAGEIPVSIVLAAMALAATLMALARSADWNLLRGSADTDDTDVAEPVRRRQLSATRPEADIDEDDGEGWLSRITLVTGAAMHAAISFYALLKRRFVRREDAYEHDYGHDFHIDARTGVPAHSGLGPDVDDYENDEDYDQDDWSDEDAAFEAAAAAREAQRASRVHPSKSRLKQGNRVSSEAQPSLLDRGGYEMPPLRLLAEAPAKSSHTISPEALDQNARLLESVLEDFGVRGEIINVRPGPVVTLYELEPAPGTKSSRVIGLADDIARSMSAISARVAVVPGRNAIGIELPNANRDTVYLRELLASVDFEKNKSRLPLCLGKTIGGEPVIADLARMPHLLIAGTTGSGKSVAINTMILSILYRLDPDQCKLIMVDPKMLELSVYDGIPHLLAPVVTDPRKAVVALKWTVREMEDRYRKMSKVGVRNIDGYNQKVAQSGGAGETFTRQVQTGFDAETGQPVYETEEVSLEAMSYIVVIIDEMADLMMVAGKDIEGAVQRLAQMARAAGIHVVMATQRPSVDVITGTIKANFPTRISFQVTSKIDSRTILGEQGAEQLLGQGDMLYMMGGGRITRVHGPFVSDDEVEDVVAHLKAQGAPEYLEAITEEPEEGGYELPGMDSGSGGGGNELYDQAVAVVLRDRKASTSYVQRRLSIGYNRAASLIERMEEEGVISRPNSKGHREILVGEDAAQ
ncbi:MAG: DNA translocase FtsK 4TM domain-containing protein [Rhodobiaceae bacterium]|nr:DNA translocase FtsK 4TM domain-containing protein [Rhodobiaceae bacterium]